MNGSLIAGDLSQMLVYVNTVTGGLFMPFMVIFFFAVTFITSMIMQQRFTGYIRPETSLVAASFVSTGLSVILLINGLIIWQIPIASVAIFVIALIWVVYSSPTQ
jgi:hypothetical protein